MGICKYCGQSAGLFARWHKECIQEAEKNRSLGAKVIRALIEVAARDKQAATELSNQINKTASTYKLEREIVGHTLLAALDGASREEPIETGVAELLLQCCQAILGDWEKIAPHSPYTTYRRTVLNLGLSRNLWCVMKGEKFSAVPTPCDIVLQKGEERLAEFGTVMYRKTVMVSSHSGGYNGVSVRIASGLYYRFGGYSGQQVAYPNVQNIDSNATSSVSMMPRTLSSHCR